MKVFGLCSRCGRAALELLRTHSYCWECSYFPDSNPELAQWHALEYRQRRSHSDIQAEPFHRNWLRGIV